jgi:undecaprenyl phosphate-alpha-L-ara4N flippase subunit ArnE
MGRTKMWAVGLVVLVTLLTSVAQVLYKFGSARLPVLFTNYHLIIGLCLYAVGAVLLVTAFKGGEVTMLYPVVATSYIWVALMSYYFFSESIGILKIAGIALVIAGIVSVGLGSKRDAIEYTEAV